MGLRDVTVRTAQGSSPSGAPLAPLLQVGREAMHGASAQVHGLNLMLKLGRGEGSFDLIHSGPMEVADREAFVIRGRVPSALGPAEQTYVVVDPAEDRDNGVWLIVASGSTSDAEHLQTILSELLHSLHFGGDEGAPAPKPPTPPAPVEPGWEHAVPMPGRRLPR